MKQWGNFKGKVGRDPETLSGLVCHNQSLTFIPWAKGDHGKKQGSNIFTQFYVKNIQ